MYPPSRSFDCTIAQVLCGGLVLIIRLQRRQGDACTAKQSASNGTLCDAYCQRYDLVTQHCAERRDYRGGNTACKEWGVKEKCRMRTWVCLTVLTG